MFNATLSLIYVNVYYISINSNGEHTSEGVSRIKNASLQLIIPNKVIFFLLRRSCRQTWLKKKQKKTSIRQKK